MDRFWIKQYPPGTPADIDPNEYTSLKQLIEAVAASSLDRTAYHSDGQRLSYAELDRTLGALRRLAAAARPEERRSHRDHAAQHLQYPVVMFGALRAGLTVVNTNPLYTATELEHQLRDSGAPRWWCWRISRRWPSGPRRGPGCPT
jgi:long-chain acyl-CoA synthetase